MAEQIPDLPPDYDADDVTSIPTDTDAKYKCEVCGTPLEYAGRGRPPTKCAQHKETGSRSTTRTVSSRSTSVVESAVASLHGFYVMILFPMQMVAPLTAEKWSGEIDGLDARNRQILASNPKLAKQIASATDHVGLPALIAVNAATLGPILLSMRGEMAYRRAERMQRGSDDA